MELRRGIPVSPGVAIGPAMVLDTESYRIPQRFISRGAYPEEIARFQAALSAAAAEARDKQRIISEKVGDQYGAIFGAHALALGDSVLRSEIESNIRDQSFTA